MIKLVPAFSDQPLYFHCSHCNAHCCGPGDIGLFRDEYDFIRKKKPAISSMFDTGGIKGYLPNGFVSLYKPSDCWFLDETNLCLIEIHYGRMHKPFLCKSFPYTFLRVGASHVIATIFLNCVFSFDQQDSGQLLSWNEVNSIHENNCLHDLYETAFYSGTRSLPNDQETRLKCYIDWEVVLRDQSPKSPLVSKLAYHSATLEKYSLHSTPVKPSHEDVMLRHRHLKLTWDLWNQILELDVPFNGGEELPARLLAFFTSVFRIKELYGNIQAKGLPDPIRFALFPYKILAMHYHLTWSDLNYSNEVFQGKYLMNIFEQFGGRFWTMALCGHFLEIKEPGPDFRLHVSESSTCSRIAVDLVRNPDVLSGMIMLRHLASRSLEQKLRFLDAFSSIFPLIASIDMTGTKNESVL